jgi:hypothetical protein
VVLERIGDIAQQRDVGNRLGRPEENTFCADCTPHILDLREYQRR